MKYLNPNDFKSVVRLVSDYATDTVHQKTLFDAIVQPQTSGAKPNINFGLDAATFASQLVTELDSFGELDNGTPALVPLLEHLKRSQGLSGRAEIDRILSGINAVAKMQPVSRDPHWYRLRIGLFALFAAVFVFLTIWLFATSGCADRPWVLATIALAGVMVPTFLGIAGLMKSESLRNSFAVLAMMTLVAVVSIPVLVKCTFPPTPTPTPTPTWTPTATPTVIPPIASTPVCRIPDWIMSTVASECQGNKFEGNGGLFIPVPNTCGVPPDTTIGFNIAWTVSSPRSFGGCTINFVPAPTPQYSSLDACGSGSLSFQIIGLQGGEKFKVGLRDASGREHNELVEALAQTQTVTISLSKFKAGGIDLNNVKVLIFAAENNRTSNTGSVCISDIRITP